MGWCSGTEVFDAVVKQVLESRDISKLTQRKITKALIKSLWEQDWDCEYDSDYIYNPLVLECFKELGMEIEVPDEDNLR